MNDVGGDLDSQVGRRPARPWESPLSAAALLGPYHRLWGRRDVDPALGRRLRHRGRRLRAHLRDARNGPQHRGRLRRAARPRLLGLLRDRRLYDRDHDREVGHQLLADAARCDRLRRDRGHDPGIPDAAPPQRLPGDRHPRLRGDRPHPVHELGLRRRAQRRLEHPDAALLRLRELSRLSLPDLLLRDRDSPGHDRACLRAQSFSVTARPRLGGGARGRIRRRGRRRADPQPQAAGLHDGRDVGRPRGRLLRRPGLCHQPLELHVRPLLPGPDPDHHRRPGEPRRGHPRIHRGGRSAGGLAGHAADPFPLLRGRADPDHAVPPPGHLAAVPNPHHPLPGARGGAGKEGRGGEGVPPQTGGRRRRGAAQGRGPGAAVRRRPGGGRRLT